MGLHPFSPIAEEVDTGATQSERSADHAEDSNCNRYVRHAANVMHIVVFMFGCLQNWLPLFPDAYLKQPLYLPDYVPVPALGP